jgi:hypothetical protein
MPDDTTKSGSASTWPALVDQINQTFNLVRDVFGYALPGGVFLAVGLISKRFTLVQVQSLLSPYHLPAWAAFVAVVAACYPIGTVMAAAAYMPFMLSKTAVWLWDTFSKPSQPTALRRALSTWLATHPTEVTSEILQIRMRRPKLLDTLDRRETKATHEANDALAAEAKASLKNNPDSSQLDDLVKAATDALNRTM